jgi:hypothetical protein
MAELDRSLLAFVRLSDASFLGDLTEVPLPTRFLFILLGPQVPFSPDRPEIRNVGKAVP